VLVRAIEDAADAREAEERKQEEGPKGRRMSGTKEIRSILATDCGSTTTEGRS
jgi:hypothetical protein